ncbi:MAG: hypothetical protein WBV92_05235 [Nitrosotalea sp.]
MKLFRLGPITHVSVILNRFIERRSAMMPTLISIPSVSFVISTVIILTLVNVYNIAQGRQQYRLIPIN